MIDIKFDQLAQTIFFI